MEREPVTIADAMQQLEEARKRLSSKNSQYQSPVEKKVDMTKYPSLPEGATDTETRLLLAALQRHVLDLEVRILSFEAKTADLEKMFADFMTELLSLVSEEQSNDD